MLNRRLFVSNAAAGLALAATPCAFSQTEPKSVRIIVPFPAGGTTDALARLLAEKLRNRYAPMLIIENRAGAGGRLGVQAAKDADATGAVLVFTPDFVLTLYPHIYKKMPYEAGDFTPVAMCASTAFVLCAGPGLPEQVKTVSQVIDWSRANPKQASYASPAAGSTPHFAGMMLNQAAAADLQHVAYKGGAPAVQDLVGGHIAIGVLPTGEILPYLKSGSIRVIATTGATRSRFLPDVPTMIESGYKDVVAQSWLGILAPSSVPMPTLQRLNASIVEVLRDPEVVDAFTRIGFDVAPPMSVADFSAFVKADTAHWAPIVKATGFTADE